MVNHIKTLKVEQLEALKKQINSARSSDGGSIDPLSQLGKAHNAMILTIDYRLRDKHRTTLVMQINKALHTINLDSPLAKELVKLRNKAVKE